MLKKRGSAMTAAMTLESVVVKICFIVGPYEFLAISKVKTEICLKLS